MQNPASSPGSQTWVIAKVEVLSTYVGEPSSGRGLFLFSFPENIYVCYDKVGVDCCPLLS